MLHLTLFFIAAIFWIFLPKTPKVVQENRQVSELPFQAPQYDDARLAPSLDDETALTHAVIEGGLERVQALVRSKASLTDCTKGEDSLLIQAISAERISIIEWLFSQEVALDPKSEECVAALKYAIEESETAGGICLLKQGVPPSTDLLALALRQNNISMSQALRDAGSPLSEDAIIKTLDLARPETIRWLLGCGISLEHKDSNGETALIRAATWGDVLRAAQLLQLGAQSEITNQNGETPLIIAAGAGYQKLVQILLHHGANRHAVDNAGNTALKLAQKNGYSKIEEALFEKSNSGSAVKATLMKEITTQMKNLIGHKEWYHSESDDEKKARDDFLTPTEIHFAKFRSEIETKFGDVLSDPIAKRCIAQERDAIGEGKHVFYRAEPGALRVYQEFMHILYMFINRLSTVDSDLSFIFTRFFKTAAKEKTIYQYVEKIKKGNRNDAAHDNVVLSANIALFGNVNSSASSTWEFFLKNKSKADVNVQQLLSEVFSFYGFDDRGISDLMAASEDFNAAASLQQIIIPKEIVDDVAMLADPGYCNPMKSKISGMSDETLGFDVKHGYYTKISGLLEKYSDPLDNWQVRLLVGQNLLDATSGVEFREYTNLSDGVLKDFKVRVRNITERILLEWLQRELRKDDLGMSVIGDAIGDLFSSLGKREVERSIDPGFMSLRLGIDVDQFSPDLRSIKQRAIAQAAGEARIRTLFPAKSAKQHHQAASIWQHYAQFKDVLSRDTIAPLFVKDCARDEINNAYIPKHKVSEGTVRFVTYNVHGWRDPNDIVSISEILETIQAIDADVLVLQEATPWQNFDMEETLMNKGYFYQIKHHENMIASKLPFFGSVTIRNYKDEIGSKPRGFINVAVQLPSGRAISVYGTHLDVRDASENKRLDEIDELLAAVSQDVHKNILLMADWNAISLKDYGYRVAGRPVFELLSENFMRRNLDVGFMPTSALDAIEKRGFVNSFDHTNHNAALFGTHVFPRPRYTVWTGTVVDKIYRSPQWHLEISGSYIYYKPSSDHLPVILDVKEF